MYWAAQKIPDNPSERINNVEFQYERQFHPNVANGVMATSYALMCYLARNDLKTAVPIMKFINSQRNRVMGWSSTQVSRSYILSTCVETAIL
jgi:A-macroglobulin TED domain